MQTFGTPNRPQALVALTYRQLVLITNALEILAPIDNDEDLGRLDLIEHLTAKYEALAPAMGEAA